MSDLTTNHTYAAKPYADWDDADRARYLAADFDANGLGIDDDLWVVPFLVRALRAFANTNTEPAGPPASPMET